MSLLEPPAAAMAGGDLHRIPPGRIDQALTSVKDTSLSHCGDIRCSDSKARQGFDRSRVARELQLMIPHAGKFPIETVRCVGPKPTCWIVRVIGSQVELYGEFPVLYPARLLHEQIELANRPFASENLQIIGNRCQ